MELIELKKLALMNYLKESDYQEITIEDITEGYKESNFEAFNREYNVYNEEEREKAVREYIKESVWAFNANFVLDHVNFGDGEYYNNQVQKALEEMQGKLCESANPLILAMIENFDEFVDDATSADGYGHFLSGYDGEEQEGSAIDEHDQRCDFYIYRTN